MPRSQAINRYSDSSPINAVLKKAQIQLQGTVILHKFILLKIMILFKNTNA